MSDERALLAAICSQPEEDTPRLAYADWLDEHAGAMPKQKRGSVRMRAELIRVQCELARLPPHEEDVDTAIRRIELELRQGKLLSNTARRESWAKPLKPPPGSEGLRAHTSFFSFVRGFPGFATGSASDFLNAGETLFGLSPVHFIECLNIHGETGDRFLAQQWLTRARRLTISTNLYDRKGGLDGTDVTTTEKLFAARTLATLEELQLRNWEFGAPGSPLAGRALSSLRSLELDSGTSRGPQSFVRLGELLPAEVRLRDFSLSMMHYSVDELRIFADLAQARRLERLTLGLRSYDSAPLGPNGVRVITSAPFWVHLREFGNAQGYGGFTQAHVEELAAAPPAPNLRTLSFVSGQLGFGGSGFDTLAESAVLESVTKLDLGPGRFGDDTVQALAKSPYLNRLLNLQLGQSGIGPTGMKALTEAPWAANVVRLDLSNNSIKKRGIDALLSPRAFPRLRYLNVRGSVRSRTDKDRLRARFGDGVRV
ncbi:TIGR02996 domain-containing protein [Frigoriglobus tundricola]|uniref:TIGR02996 domain-containing protein n=1 Tax=Frigoriglobus tundricola TaxID=2774151 RepID=A0A6M5YXR7_9BACT|nr:TIGR02996 domain-containing protein [Frigoriglobus tundricola]QJW98907.1 hypothetical protein FTUN_6502 [Frigoriglobus tundricola]